MGERRKLSIECVAIQFLALFVPKLHPLLAAIHKNRSKARVADSKHHEFFTFHTERILAGSDTEEISDPVELFILYVRYLRLDGEVKLMTLTAPDQVVEIST